MLQLAKTTHRQECMFFKQGTTGPWVLDPSINAVNQAYHYNRNPWSESEWGAGTDEWVDSWLPAIPFIKLLSEAMKEW